MFNILHAITDSERTMKCIGFIMTYIIIIILFSYVWYSIVINIHTVFEKKKLSKRF